MMRASADTQAGFSLLEVMVAVAVLASIVALILPVVRNAAAVERRAVGVSESWNRHGAVETSVRELLRQSQAAPDSNPEYRLQGTAGSVSFLTRPTGYDTLYRASLSIEGDAIIAVLQSVPDQRALRQRSVLADAVDEARFYYFGDPGDGSGPGWHANWDADRPPRLVALDMARNDGQVRRVEALVAGRGQADCVFDSGLGICLGTR